jgi:hypothetical protein
VGRAILPAAAFQAAKACCGQDWQPHNWVFIIIGDPQGHEDSFLSAAVAYRREAG